MQFSDEASKSFNPTLWCFLCLLPYIQHSKCDWSQVKGFTLSSQEISLRSKSMCKEFFSDFYVLLHCFAIFSSSSSSDDIKEREEKLAQGNGKLFPTFRSKKFCCIYLMMWIYSPNWAECVNFQLTRLSVHPCDYSMCSYERFADVDDAHHETECSYDINLSIFPLISIKVLIETQLFRAFSKIFLLLALHYVHTECAWWNYKTFSFFNFQLYHSSHSR